MAKAMARFGYGPRLALTHRDRPIICARAITLPALPSPSSSSSPSSSPSFLQTGRGRYTDRRNSCCSSVSVRSISDVAVAAIARSFGVFGRRSNEDSKELKLDAAVVFSAERRGCHRSRNRVCKNLIGVASDELGEKWWRLSRNNSLCCRRPRNRSPLSSPYLTLTTGVSCNSIRSNTQDQSNRVAISRTQVQSNRLIFRSRHYRRIVDCACRRGMDDMRVVGNRGRGRDWDLNKTRANGKWRWRSTTLDDFASPRLVNGGTVLARSYVSRNTANREGERGGGGGGGGEGSANTESDLRKCDKKIVKGFQVESKPESCTADELHYVRVPETNWNIALWRYTPPKDAVKRNHPVILLAGVGATAYAYDVSPEVSLSRELASIGFDTWICELRGTGLSHNVEDGRRSSLPEVSETSASETVSYLEKIASHIGSSEGSSRESHMTTQGQGNEYSKSNKPKPEPEPEPEPESGPASSKGRSKTSEVPESGLASSKGRSKSSEVNENENGSGNWNVSGIGNGKGNAKGNGLGSENDKRSRYWKSGADMDRASYTNGNARGGSDGLERDMEHGGASLRGVMEASSRLEALRERLVEVLGYVDSSPRLSRLSRMKERITSSVGSVEIPSLPALLSLPSLPTLPRLPGLPTLPSLPDMGSLPALPAFPVWQVSSLRERLSLLLEEGQRSLELAGDFNWDFDSYLEEDLPTAIEYICGMDNSKDGKVLAVGHSMGGILLYAALGNKRLQPKLAAVVTLASALDYSVSDSILKLFLPLDMPMVVDNVPAVPLGVLSRLAVPLITRPPYTLGWIRHNISARNAMDPEILRKLLMYNFCTISVRLLLQLASVFKPGGLRNRDGTKRYMDDLATCQIPVLAFSGDKDTICPQEAVKDTANRIPRHVVRQVHLGGRSDHHYGHYDFLCGRKAKSDVFPIIRRFLAMMDHEKNSKNPVH